MMKNLKAILLLTLLAINTINVHASAPAEVQSSLIEWNKATKADYATADESTKTVEQALFPLNQDQYSKAYDWNTGYETRIKRWYTQNADGSFVEHRIVKTSRVPSLLTWGNAKLAAGTALGLGALGGAAYYLTSNNSAQPNTAANPDVTHVPGNDLRNDQLPSMILPQQTMPVSSTQNQLAQPAVPAVATPNNPATDFAANMPAPTISNEKLRQDTNSTITANLENQNQTPWWQSSWGRGILGATGTAVVGGATWFGKSMMNRSHGSDQADESDDDSEEAEDRQENLQPIVSTSDSIAPNISQINISQQDNELFNAISECNQKLIQLKELIPSNTYNAFRTILADIKNDLNDPLHAQISTIKLSTIQRLNDLDTKINACVEKTEYTKAIQRQIQDLKNEFNQNSQNRSSLTSRNSQEIFHETIDKIKANLDDLNSTNDNARIKDDKRVITTYLDQTDAILKRQQFNIIVDTILLNPNENFSTNSKIIYSLLASKKIDQHTINQALRRSVEQTTSQNSSKLLISALLVYNANPNDRNISNTWQPDQHQFDTTHSPYLLDIANEKHDQKTIDLLKQYKAKSRSDFASSNPGSTSRTIPNPSINQALQAVAAPTPSTQAVSPAVVVEQPANDGFNEYYQATISKINSLNRQFTKPVEDAIGVTDIKKVKNWINTAHRQLETLKNEKESASSANTQFNEYLIKQINKQLEQAQEFIDGAKIGIHMNNLQNQVTRQHILGIDFQSIRTYLHNLQWSIDDSVSNSKIRQQHRTAIKMALDKIQQSITTNKMKDTLKELTSKHFENKDADDL